MELSQIMTYEVTRNLKTKLVAVKTPVAACKAPRLSEKVLFVPILRAGQAMAEGALRILPKAAVGHIGIYRDKAQNSTVEYFFKMPKDITGHRVYVFDPMLATGETAVSALTRLKNYGAKSITFVCLLAAKKGLAVLQAAHPDVDVVTLSLEAKLNQKNYIVPGLGDAGDRIYGTL
jgi:uracil phosphoribosyltransferase